MTCRHAQRLGSLPEKHLFLSVKKYRQVVVDLNRRQCLYRKEEISDANKSCKASHIDHLDRDSQGGDETQHTPAASPSDTEKLPRRGEPLVCAL